MLLEREKQSTPGGQGRDQLLWLVTGLLPGKVLTVLKHPSVLSVQSSMKSTENTWHKVPGQGTVQWPVQNPTLALGDFSLLFLLLS